ncbi:MAG: hypothetical protein QM770_02975 [Tepidisphaeraceae bacterium]
MFGLCWHCQSSVSPEALTCARCRSPQDVPGDADVFIEVAPAMPVMREVSSEPADADDLNQAIQTAVNEADPPVTPRERPRHERTAPRTAGEAIMSAKDLAAVFQLDTRGSFSRRMGRKLAIAAKVALALAVLGGGATAGLLYAKPEFRDPAKRLTNDLAKGVGLAEPFTTTQPAVEPTKFSIGETPAPVPPRILSTSIQVSGVTPKSPTPVTPVSATPVSVTPVAPTPTPTPNAQAIAHDAPTTQQSFIVGPTNHSTPDVPSHPQVAQPTTPRNDASPTTAPVNDIVKTPDPVVVQPTPEAPTKEPEPAHATPAPPVAPADAPSTQPTYKPLDPPPAPAADAPMDDWVDYAAALRRQALDAEAHRDWATAVKRWETIDALAADAQPTDTKPRLAKAREMLAKQLLQDVP